MLWGSWILAVLVAMAWPSGGLATESGMLELTERDCGQTRSLSLGGLCRLTLEEQGGTGFVWEPVALDRKRLEVLEVTTVGLGEKPQVGGPVAKTWLFRTVGRGKTRLALAYRRPWEQQVPPARRCEILLEVR
jgi:predicted secreted protein